MPPKPKRKRPIKKTTMTQKQRVSTSQRTNVSVNITTPSPAKRTRSKATTKQQNKMFAPSQLPIFLQAPQSSVINDYDKLTSVLRSLQIKTGNEFVAEQPKIKERPISAVQDWLIGSEQSSRAPSDSDFGGVASSEGQREALKQYVEESRALRTRGISGFLPSETSSSEVEREQAKIKRATTAIRGAKKAQERMTQGEASSSLPIPPANPPPVKRGRGRPKKQTATQMTEELLQLTGMR